MLDLDFVYVSLTNLGDSASETVRLLNRKNRRSDRESSGRSSITG